MTTLNSFEKRVAGWRVSVSTGWPRQVEISREDLYGKGITMQLEDARDVHYALGRIIEMADEDDERRLAK